MNPVSQTDSKPARPVGKTQAKRLAEFFISEAARPTLPPALHAAALSAACHSLHQEISAAERAAVHYCPACQNKHCGALMCERCWRTYIAWLEAQQ